MSDMEFNPRPKLPRAFPRWQRVIDTFTAPSKTFEDIKRGNRSWWMPFLIISRVQLHSSSLQLPRRSAAASCENQSTWIQKPKSGWHNSLPHNGTQPMKFTRTPRRVSSLASPLSHPRCSGPHVARLVGTINFVFGGKANFASVFAMWMFAGLPGIIKTLLGMIVIYAGTAPESFNLNNFAPTNAGAFLTPIRTQCAYSINLPPLSISLPFGAWCCSESESPLSLASSVAPAILRSSDGGQSSSSLALDGQP